MTHNGRPLKHRCPICKAGVRVVSTHLISGVRRTYVYCDECDNRYRIDKRTKAKPNRYAQYPPSIREVMQMPDSELDMLYGDPDAPRLTMVRWYREILENRQSLQEGAK